MIQQFFAARSLRFRFMWVLSICLLALGLLLTIALNSFDRLEQQATRAMVAKDLVADILPPPMYLVELRLLLSEAVEGNVSPDIAASRFEELRKAYDARAKHWQTEPPYGLETSLLGLQHQLALQLFKDAQQNIIKPLQQHDLEDAQQGLQRLHPVYIEHRKAVDATIVKGNALAEESVLAFERARWRGLLTMLVVAVLTVGLMTLALLGMQSAIMQTLSRAGSVTKAVADGDLRLSSENASSGNAGHSRNELRQLQAQVQGMVHQLRPLVQQLQGSAANIEVSTQRIAASNADLSSRAQLEIQDLDKAGDSLQVLNTQAQQGTESARQADQISISAAQGATLGADQMHAVVGIMGEIKHSSDRISDITGTIDGIAFQTNILALNAAVEAARAGEQGRGFAVVASEVRALAQRSSVAAREIKQLILSSGERVQSGEQAAQKTLATISHMAQEATQVSTLIRGTSAQLQQQVDCVADLRQLLQSITERIHQNSGLVTQTAAESEQLLSEAERLLTAAQRFRI